MPNEQLILSAISFKEELIEKYIAPMKFNHREMQLKTDLSEQAVNKMERTAENIHFFTGLVANYSALIEIATLAETE